MRSAHLAQHGRSIYPHGLCGRLPSHLCVWQAGLAHFGILFWPTPGMLKVWEIFIPWSSGRWECGNRC